jgi:hypothetical protein
MQGEENEWSLVRLKWAVQALALPENEQRGLFPSFVWVGDELALDFYECRETALKDRVLTDDQLAALVSLDTTLSKMAAENNMELWDEPGVDHPRWEEVRGSAKDALKRLDGIWIRHRKTERYTWGLVISDFTATIAGRGASNTTPVEYKHLGYRLEFNLHVGQLGSAAWDERLSF